MEKFSNWRDKGTGISPFMPTPEQATLFMIVPKAIAFLMKMPIFVLALGVYFLLPFPAIGRFIIFVLFGFRNYDLTVDGVKKSRTDEINATKPTVGDFVVVNYQSPIDGLILAALSNANWSKIAILIPNKEGELYQYSIWGLIRYTLSTNIGVPTSTIKIGNYSSLKDKLVFCFIEGTPSNNKSILPFMDSFVAIPKAAFNFKTLILKIQPGYLTTPLPIVSKRRYFVRLLTNLSKNSSIRAKIFKHAPTESKDTFDFRLLKHCFEVGQLNLIGQDLNINQKINFYNYYIDHKVKKQ